MAKDYVLVLDIGSSRLRAMTASKGLNNTFIVKGNAEAEYDGYYEGRFLNPDALCDIIKSLLGELDFEVSRKHNKIFIGVPAEFSSVTCTTASVNLGERRKVKQSDIDNLFYSTGEKAKLENVEVVSIDAITFRIDEGHSSINPVGEYANSLSAELSIIYCVKEFIELFNKIVASLGFESVEYISEPLSEGLFVINDEGREDLNMLINVGDLTTNISFVKGNALASLASFSIGGGHITNDLSEAFDITLTEADRLKRQIVLSLRGKNNDFYELTSDFGKIIKIPLITANEVVAARIEILSSAVNQCIQLFSTAYIPYLPVYLTGAGVSAVKGGRDYMAKCLGRNIKYGVPPLPGKDKPQNASMYSLVNTALDKA